MLKTVKQNTLIVGIILAMLLVACNSTTKLPEIFKDYRATNEVEKADEEISHVRTELHTAEKTIREETEGIRFSLIDIEKRIPSKHRHNFLSDTDSIRDRTDVIDEQTTSIQVQEQRLAKVQDMLSSASARILQMERLVGDYQKSAKNALAERDEAIENMEKAKIEADNASRSMLKWLILTCTIGGGAGIAVMIFGRFSIGGMLAVASGCVLVFAMAVEQYFNYIAYGGVVIILIAIGYLAYMVFIRNRAVEEIVHTTEIAKRKLPPEKRKEIFGHKEDTGKVHAIQSKSTEKLVKSVREQFRAAWSHTVPGDGKVMDTKFDSN